MDMAWGRSQGGADHADHDCRHGDVLIAARVLAEHALGNEQEHQQPSRQCRLDDDQWR
jgi:hypothetical protein